MFDTKIYLRDILSAINKIEEYTKGLSFSDFEKKNIVIDAVVRNLMIIGEAVKSVPEDFREENKEIEWKRIACFRDIAIHAYSNLDLKVVWEILKKGIPKLREQINSILNKE